jgi:hypothetical protein
MKANRKIADLRRGTTETLNQGPRRGGVDWTHYAARAARKGCPAWARAAVAGCCFARQSRGGIRNWPSCFLLATSQIAFSAVRKVEVSWDAGSKCAWTLISEITASAFSNLPDRASACA